MSMGYNASLKAYQAVRLARYIFASELICGAQAADCYEDRPLAPAPWRCTGRSGRRCRS